MGEHSENNIVFQNKNYHFTENIIIWKQKNPNKT